MLALFSPSVVPLVTKSGQNADSNVSGINIYRDSHGRANPLPLNNTRNQSNNTQGYKKTTSAESTQYQLGGAA